jgi:pyruvate dehydrogenase E2 component (dihydrolipoamide acetyltransferase)
VTLSSDHRIIDGVLAARFLRELKTLLEQPVALLV